MPLPAAYRSTGTTALNPSGAGTTGTVTPAGTIAQFDDSWMLDPEPGLDETVIGTSGGDELDGGDGDDVMYGLLGNDVMHGGTGRDRLEGDNGDDELFGDDGNDELNGGNGNDRLQGGNGHDVLDGGDGDDALFGDDGNIAFDGSDTLYGGAGNDLLNGNAGDDLLFGGDGNDVMLGSAGSDVLIGGEGNDDLYGGGGDDVLDGGAGSDVLYGGAAQFGGHGRDTLTGGTGADIFIFEDVPDSGFPQYQHDVITDFSYLQQRDILLLSPLLDKTDFTGTTAAEAVQQGYLRYEQHGDNGAPGEFMRIIIDPNGNAPDEGYVGMLPYTVVDLLGVITVHVVGLESSMFIV